MALVIGLDAGGTGSRAVAVDADGVVRGAATGPAGNAATVPAGVLADRITACLEDCLADAGASPRDVGGVAAGLAGLRAAPGAEETVRAAAKRAGLDCPVRAYSDVDVAFAAGSDRPDGVVLIAGTGASAARLKGFEVVAVADGAGWLLGDEGGGFWIARRAVRSVLAALDGRGPSTELEPVLAAELGASRTLHDVVAAAMALPPPGLAVLAPRVFDVAAAGDEVAAGIVAEAVERLAHTASALHPLPGEPLVLAGGLLGPSGPLSDPVRRALTAHGGPDVTAVADGALGAAKLARLALAESKY